jgi:hypothetical protein
MVRSLSAYVKVGVIALPCGIFEGDRNVLGLEKRAVLRDLLARRGGCKEIEHILQPNSETPDAGAPAALLWVGRHSIQFSHAKPFSRPVR